MDATPFKDESTLKKAFTKIATLDIKNYTCEIIELVANNELSRERIQDILSKYYIQDIQKIKTELLDVLIAYANFVLEDDLITNDEKSNFEFLKLYFEIKEGDFYIHKKNEIKVIINRQLERIYQDNLITQNESESNTILQDMFDLDYDQLDKMKEDFVLKSIEQGAEIIDLDTANVKFSKKKKQDRY